MANETNDKIIKEKFKHGLKGVVFNSGGWTQLFGTKFNLWSLIITLFLIVLFILNVDTNEKSLKLIDSLNSTANSILGGIVGLSLAGLTLIITFGNPEVIENSAKKQSLQFSSTENFDVSYFQKAIAKFAFIVFFQVLSLIFFFISSIIRGMDIEISEKYVYYANLLIFSIGTYLMVFSLILVVASIMNLFTFSQTSNFFNFIKHIPTRKTSDHQDD